MFVTTYSDARNNFATVLDTALAEGNVVVVRADGTEFNISPRLKTSSPFENVQSVVHLNESDFTQMLDDMKQTHSP